MATKKEKEELIQTLKFTPTKVRMLIQGYGGECYAGRVDRKIYDYFAQQRIDLEEYAGDWDGVFNDNVPRELQPFSPGSPYDCDGLWHASGAELSDLNEIRVDSDDGQEIWVHNCGYSDLEDAGVTVDQCGGEDLDDLDENEVVLWGGQGEKGCFFDAEFTLTAPFDPKKLTIGYENCDGWYIINSVEYDGEELDGTGGYSTTGKWAEHKWILGGDEEVYDSVALDDREDEGLEWDTMPESSCTSEEWDPVNELDKILNEIPLTDWYPRDVKPVHKGEYEVDLGKEIAWPFSRIIRAEWSGRAWKNEEGKTIKGVMCWRGLVEDPNKLVVFKCECVQCSWSGPIDDTHDNDGEMCCPECGEPVELK
jgi:hypothetical protein